MKGDIVIRKADIAQLKTEGSNLVVKKDAEAALLTLLDLKDLVDKTIQEVKEKIIECGQKAMGEGFKGVVGENVKAVYRAYGNKFETTNPEFVKSFTIQRTDSYKIGEYLKENGKLPENTIEKKREKKLIINRINE